MRNLSLLSEIHRNVGTRAEDIVTNLTVNTDDNSIFAVVEFSSDGESLASIWKISSLPKPVRIAETRYKSAPDARVVSLKLFPESQRLCLVLSGGDIQTGILDENVDVCQLNSEGSVESGIETAVWSPDDELLLIATGDDKLIQMTTELDILLEVNLRPDEFGEDQAVNVGWGSKQTQFHGSLGKGAAAGADGPALVRCGSSPDDDGLPRISWRGDGAFFVVSTRDPHPTPDLSKESFTQCRRVLRVYDRLGSLQTTSEATPGLESAVAWRPSGNLIASAQRFGFPGGGQGRKGRHDVVFFERNGLRHGEFLLREPSEEISTSKYLWGYRIREIAWNSDSSILALWIERETGDSVQLWTSGNYHWYLKQEIFASVGEDQISRYQHILWHPEDALCLLMAINGMVRECRFGWETSRSTNDASTVVVVDGTSLLMTPFLLQNQPPPMSSYRIQVDFKISSVPVHVSHAMSGDGVVVINQACEGNLWLLQTKPAISGGLVAEPVLHWKGEIPGNIRPRQVIAWDDPVAPEEWFVATLGLPSGARHDVVSVIAVRGGVVTDDYEISLPETGRGRLICLGGDSLAWQGSDGVILRVDFENEITAPLTQFPEHCVQVETICLEDGRSAFCGLAHSGRLHVVTTATDAMLLSSKCTSFVIGAGFVVYATTDHVAKFFPISTLGRGASQDAPSPSNVEQRRVERGSRIVTTVPAAMSLVLQMPRGNLEIIHPRPFVLAFIRRSLDQTNYRDSFVICRKHKIDFSVLVDHDVATFMQSIDTFLEQIPEEEYLNLFLTGIGQSQLPQYLVAKACDEIRDKLEKKDLKQYIHSIITAHVVKTPPDVETALRLILQLQLEKKELAENAIKYIIFLVDADHLFDAALGLYEFPLVLLVAQHSPKRDPREYLPFLRELQEGKTKHGEAYQKFKIDDHLKKPGKALASLRDAGFKWFEDALNYMEKHNLHLEALSMWPLGSSERRAVLKRYAEYHYERREFKQAAWVFQEAGETSKAMASFERAHLWQEQFSLAIKSHRSDDEIKEMAERVGQNLMSRKSFSDAGRVFLDYGKDLHNAITAFSQGGYFAEADRQCALHKRLDLVEEILHPVSLEVRDQILEDLQDVEAQMKKQSGRLKELRQEKLNDPGEFTFLQDRFYMVKPHSGNLQDVDVKIDAGESVTGFTTFTRYTVAPSSGSMKSKSSFKQRKKQSRKHGRKGTFEEEDYILLSIAKMPERLIEVQERVGRVLPYLLIFGSEYREAAESLQESVKELQESLHKTIDDAWQDLDMEDEGTTRITRLTPPRPTASISLTNWESSTL